MRGEFCVTQLIRWNPKLRSRLCAWLEIDKDEDFLRSSLLELAEDGALESRALRFGCRRDEVFMFLRQRLANEVLGLSFDEERKLEISDLRIFLEDAFLMFMKAKLNCEAEWPIVVKHLFDETRLTQTLQDTGISKSNGHSDLSALFWRLISPDGISALQRYFRGPVDIWVFLTSIVNDNAAVILCEGLGCQRENIFPTVVMQIRGSTKKVKEHLPKIEDEGKGLDMLAVAKIREVLLTIMESYLRQARAAVKEAQNVAVTPNDVRLFEPFIAYYYEKAYRRALIGAFPEDIRIGELGFSITPVNAQAAEPYDERTEIRLEVNEAQPAHITIYFRRNGSTEWTKLADLEGQDSSMADHIVQKMPRLASRLAGKGSTLIEHIMQGGLPAPESVERAAWSIAVKSDSSLIQYFVLSGNAIPDQFGISSLLSGKASGYVLSEDSKTQRVRCKSTREIYDDIQKISIDRRIADK